MNINDFYESKRITDQYGRTHLAFVKYWPTSFGNYLWSVTNWATGQGLSGFTTTVELAWLKIEQAANEDMSDIPF